MEGFQRFVRRYITFPVCLQKVMSRKKSDSTVAKKKKQMKALLFSLSFQRSQQTRAEMLATQARPILVASSS